MPRLTTIIALLAVGVLLLSGVVEVRLNPDKFGNIPGVVSDAGSGNFGNIGRLAIGLKRKGEIFFTDSATERLQQHLTYIATDADKLNELLAAQQSESDAILGQATLLVQSLEDARSQAATIDPEQLVSMQEQSDTAITNAKQSLSKLYELQEEYQFNQERLAEITSNVELNLGQLDAAEEGEGSADDQGDIAGAEDKEAEPSAADSNDSLQSVPLRF